MPENRDVLYLRAVAQRMLGDIPAALGTLAELERLHPRFSRLYQERGYCYVALKQAPQAIEAFLRGVNINPALPASWRMLESLYRMTGQTATPRRRRRTSPRCSNCRPRWSRPRRCSRTVSSPRPSSSCALSCSGTVDHVEAMRLLARIGMERDVLDDAQMLLEAVLDIAPDYRAARFEYAQVLVRRHMYREAQRADREAARRGSGQP